MRAVFRRAVLGAVLAVASLLAAADPAQAQNRFWLVNNTGETIEAAFVSPSRVNSWGPDVLGTNVLPVGQRIWIVPQTSDCLLDVKVRYPGGREETRWQVNTCTLATIFWGGGGAVAGKGGAVAAGDPSFTFVNQTGRTIREVYVSRSSERAWGPDRLGANTLPPGGTVYVGLPPGPVRTVDMRVVYMDGGAQERRGVETCSRSDVGWR